MTHAEIGRAVDWAAAEGWNPGLHDADCFAMVDAEGFIGGLLDGELVSSISVVNYDPSFAFLGFYIVQPSVRGRGHGLSTWQAGIAHAGSRVIGLDGVVAQQENYRRSGFALAYRNIRYGGIARVPRGKPRDGCRVLPATDVPIASLLAYDRIGFPAPRPAFLKTWLTAPDHVARVLTRDGALAGLAVARPCRKGVKVGPLFADDDASAEALFAAVTIGFAAGTELFLDVPEINAAAVALAESAGLTPVFETARMYRGAPRAIDISRVFGVTSFELG